MDILDSLLADLKISSSVYFCDFLKPPWKLDYQGENRGLFHLVRRGRCILIIGDSQYELLPGDLVFVSPKINHHIMPPKGDVSEALLLCGYCTFDANEDDMRLLDIPPYLVIQQNKLEQLPWLVRTLEHLSAEYLSQEYGRELTINKLSELFFVQLLRSEFLIYRNKGLVAALRDQRLEKALTAIHSHLDQHWTLDTAAKVATMSRSGFAKKFVDILGVNFYEYLTRTRLRKARYLLKHTNSGVSNIALRVGYTSDLSFIKMFKKYEGMTPRAYGLEHIT